MTRYTRCCGRCGALITCASSRELARLVRQHAKVCPTAGAEPRPTVESGTGWLDLELDHKRGRP